MKSSYLTRFFRCSIYCAPKVLCDLTFRSYILKEKIVDLLTKSLDAAFQKEVAQAYDVFSNAMLLAAGDENAERAAKDKFRATLTVLLKTRSAAGEVAEQVS